MCSVLTPNHWRARCTSVVRAFAHGEMGSDRSFMVDPLNYFSFQPVLDDWCNKGCGMFYPVCGTMNSCTMAFIYYIHLRKCYVSSISNRELHIPAYIRRKWRKCSLRVIPLHLNGSFLFVNTMPKLRLPESQKHWWLLSSITLVCHAERLADKGTLTSQLKSALTQYDTESNIKTTIIDRTEQNRTFFTLRS